MLKCGSSRDFRFVPGVATASHEIIFCFVLFFLLDALDAFYPFLYGLDTSSGLVLGH